jgi:tetratricopeptide (TPR) repeat protein
MRVHHLYIAVALYCWMSLLCSTNLAQSQQKRLTSTQHLERGEEAFRNKNLRLALADFNEAIRLDPFLWQAYFSRAQTRERLGDSQGAMTDLNIFLESNPSNAEALFSRAVLRYQNGQWAVAREDFLKLLDTPPGETTTVFFQTDKSNKVGSVFTTQTGIRSTCFTYLGLTDLKLAQYKRAINYFDSALRLSPKCGDCFVNRGMGFQHLRDTTQAISDYQQALKLAPDNSLAQHNLAILSGFRGKLKETEAMLTEAIEQKPDLPYSYAERGHVRMRQQNWKGALSDFDKAISIDPADPDDWLNRGLVKEKLKDLSGALNDITQAIKLKSDFEKAWLCRGNLMMKLNRVADAVEDYGLAIFHYADYGPAYYNRALAYHKQGKLKEACRDLREAQRLDVKIERKVFDSICK